MFKWLLRLLMVLVFIIVGATVYTYYVLQKAAQPITLAQESLLVTIPPNSSLTAIGLALQKSGVAVELIVFKAIALKLGVTNKLQAGVYRISSGTTTEAIVRRMAKGKTHKVRIVFIEGWTFAQIRKRVRQNRWLKHETTQMNAQEILRALGSRYNHPEGLFFPDTYLVDPGSSDLALYRQAHRKMLQSLATVWQQRQNDLPLKSPYEALILASIIEKETGLAQDRGAVASVFINRLRKDMRLQTDPTVIYGLGARFTNNNLTKKHLLTDQPYNSYTRKGLPPTPISNPGYAALAAAVNPPKTDWLYFVARGDGSSQFSRSLREHNRAVAKFQLKKR